jgi:Protein of unknown function (DUF3108)
MRIKRAGVWDWAARIAFPSRRMRRRSALVLPLCIGFQFATAAESPILAGTKIEVNYAVAYLGVTIGSGKWQIELAGDQYVITASGQIKGMMSVLINGQGSGSARGLLSHGHAIASGFDADVASTAENDSIQVSFQSGAVKELLALPPFPPLPQRVPMTESLLQKVIDPLSAAAVFVDSISGVVPNACERRLPIFDGRRRYDVDLVFKRLENTAVPPAYRGTAVVCSVHLIPIAGHQVDSSAIKYLIESKDIEIHYAFIPEAHIVVPIAATVPTLIGTIYVHPEQIDVAVSSAPEVPAIPHQRR